MKSLPQTLLFLLLVTQICFAQWYQQNSGTTQNLNEIYFSGNRGRVVGDLGTVLSTLDGGLTWNAIESGTTKNINGVIPVIERDWMSVGDSGLIILYDSILTGIPSVELNSVSWIAAYNQSCAVGDNGTILISDYSGYNWVIIQNDKPYGLKDVTFSLVDYNGWAVGDSGMILKTIDEGENWLVQNTGINANFKCVQFINQDVGWIGGRGVILKTTDGGANWTAIQTPGLTTTAVCFADEFNGWSVANTNFGYSGMIQHTTDGGQTWEVQLTQVKPLWSIQFVDENNGWAVGDSGSIYHTTNGGVPVELTSFTATVKRNDVILNWATATELNNHGFEVQRSNEKNNFATIAFVNGNGTTTEQHSYIYIDKNLNNGKYYYRLKQVDFNGTYEYSKSTEVVFAPNKFSLEQNYPNPFNPSTKIKYSISQKSIVQIKVFNVLGIEIETLVNEEKTAGTYELVWNATNLPSGVYFYQLKAGDFIKTKKMILLK